MALDRRFLDQLGIEHPIIQAPMAGSDTPALIAAVSNAGGLGVCGAAYLSPAQIAEAVAAIRARTARPFGINLFAGGRSDEADAPTGELARGHARLARFYEALGLPMPTIPERTPDPFPAQLEAVFGLDVPVFTFTFGVPSAQAIGEFKRRGIVVIGTATTVTEARLVEAAG